jgi:hypothetical protein
MLWPHVRAAEATMDCVGKIGTVIVLMTWSLIAAGARAGSSRAEIDAFIQKYLAAHKNLDTRW